MVIIVKGKTQQQQQKRYRLMLQTYIIFSFIFTTNIIVKKSRRKSDLGNLYIYKCWLHCIYNRLNLLKQAFYRVFDTTY